VKRDAEFIFMWNNAVYDGIIQLVMRGNLQVPMINLLQ